MTDPISVRNPSPCRHRVLALAAVLVLRLPPAFAATVASPIAVPAPSGSSPEDDLRDAHALFEKNLDAIRRRDRESYLACYLPEPALTRTGPEGMKRGFDPFAAEVRAQDSWPDRLDAADLTLAWLRPGLVYGTYRYRVRYGSDERRGLSERFFLRGDGGDMRIAVTTAFEAPPGTPPPPLAITGAALVDGRGGAPVADAVVILRAGLIDCAGTRTACPLPDGVDTLDASGLTLVPGLIDAHVHFSQTGWADGRPDALDVRAAYPYESVAADLAQHPERFFRSYLCSGVTAVFDVGGYPWTLDLPGRAEREAIAPHVAAAGPLLSTWDFWLNLPGERQFVYLASEEAARAGVRWLAARGSSAIKVWFIPVAERGFAEMEWAVAAAGDAACQANLPLIVHATGLREAKAALRAGAHLLVHSVWDQPVDDEFLRLAGAGRAVYCPTLTVIDGYERMFAAAAAGKAPAIDDPNRCVDAATLARVAATAELGQSRVSAEELRQRRAANTERHRIMAQNLWRVHQAGIPIAMGTDAGNPLTLHGTAVYAEMEAMVAAGLTPMEVLVAATRGGALAMGRETDLGTIERGKSADLVLVAGDPAADIRALRSVRYVVRGGVLRPLESLQRTVP